MGLKTAIEIAESPLSLEHKMEWHLSGNFYPPISLGYAPLAADACRHAAHDLWDDLLIYPDGQIRSVRKTVEDLHLEPFIASVPVEEGE